MSTIRIIANLCARRILFIGIIFSCSVSSAANKLSIPTTSVKAVVPSSTIPDKREYPINNSISPCDNFYEYACSSVISNFKLRDDRSIHIFAFSDATERLLEFKKTYFSNLSKKIPESAVEGEVKNYYLACMNKEGRKKEEVAIVKNTQKLLKKIKTREQFLDMVAKNITDPDQLSFISFNADLANLDKPNYNDLCFNTNLMTLPEKGYYNNKQIAKDLKKIIRQFFISIGDRRPEQKARWVFNFEKNLSQKYPTPPEIDELLYSRTTISREDLIKNYPYLRLTGFLTTIPKHVVIRNIIGNDTMEYLNRKLKNASLEELKAIYLYFQLASIMDDAYPDFFAKKFEFNKKYLGGPSERASRHERCTLVAMNNFDREVDSILLPKIFPNFPKEKVTKLIEKIRTSLLSQLKSNTWLQNVTKKEAVRKIKNVKFLLVNPNNEDEWNFNPQTNYTADSPIANSHKLKKLLMDKRLKELNGPVKRNRWPIGPLSVNALYDESYNLMVLPIGILQYPFYDPNESEEINLGAIGTVVGHELGHAIDNYGSRFNADGVFKQWLSSEDVKIFDNKTKRLISQFDKIGHNGKFTLGENIGDLVGLTTSYKAAFPNNNDSNQELKKKFFLQIARLRCEAQRQGIKERRLKTDPHSLGFARINEQVKHQIGFKQAYNCKRGDPMVISEDEIIKVW